jgi:RecQ family ATP-dependent DNA helicase
MLLEQARVKAISWGHGALRDKQIETLCALSERRSCFAALPTGYGKSLCYQLPAAAWGWRILVISPLVALIQDQAHSAEALGLAVVAWHGGLTAEEKTRLAEKTRARDWQLCFLSPERFLSWQLGPRARALSPALVVLDEMHCLTEWGEFREGYRDLAVPLRDYLAATRAPLLGLSASMPAAESKSWMARLVPDHARVTSPLGRENVVLRVAALERGEERWLRLVEELRGLQGPESALVYCFSRDEADQVARWLRSVGQEAVAFHAGLPAFERAERTRAFRAGRLRVICATSAFGMGIDYAHVTRVVHFSMPRDLESYWQEVGRAGRGGQPARATAFWRRSEITRARILEPLARERFFSLWTAWAGARCRKVVVAERLGLEQQTCGECDRCAVSNSFDSRNAWWFSPEAELKDWIERWKSETEQCQENKNFAEASERGKNHSRE